MEKALLVTVCVFAAVLAGCIDREMTITSEPPGALVEISGRQIGRTPVTTQFTWYGDYEIILRREGCETLKAHANVDVPWYGVPPIDFLSEIAPWTYMDRRYLNFSLKKLVVPGDNELIEKAGQMEQKTLEPVNH